MSNTVDLVRCAPLSVLRPSRLDLVVKYLFFRELLDGRTDRGRVLYEQHIARRTGGFEGPKRSVGDFVSAGTALLESLRTRGFDDTCPISISATNGLPLDGAHRIAASMALGQEIAIQPCAEAGHEWGYEWFRRAGFSQPDLDALVRTYARLSTYPVAFIFWGAVAPKWDALSVALAAHASIVGWSDVTLEQAELPVVLDDIYAWSSGPATQARIRDKASALATALPGVRVVLVEAPAGTTDLRAFAAQVKSQLRAVAGHDAEDFWTTVHATDTADEARYMTELLFNPNYKRLLAWRRNVEPRAEFLRWLQRYQQTLDAHGVAAEDACIVGSSVLEAVGLRESTDIDCIVGTREPRFHPGVVVLGEGVDLATSGYHRRADGGNTWSDAEVVSDPERHFRFRGLKFANPELVIDRKRQHGRPKDVADVELWERREAAVSFAPGYPAAWRIVVWQPVAIDVIHTLNLRRLSDAARSRGVEIVVAGPPVVPAFLGIPCIPSPPPIDRLPVSCFHDVDPSATLRALGADPGVLLDAAAAQWGRFDGSTHAYRRLRALAWTARWMSGWLADLDAAAVHAPGDDVFTVLLRGVAGRAGLELLPGLDIEPPPSAAPSRRATETVMDSCGRAAEPLRLFAAMADIEASGQSKRGVLLNEIERLEVRLVERQNMVSLLQAAIDSAAHPLWVWGTGAAGARTVEWLLRRGATLAGLIDSDPQKQGTALAGVHVSPPEAFREWRRRRDGGSPRPRIVIASMYAASIREHLRTMELPPVDVLDAPLDARAD